MPFYEIKYVPLNGSTRGKYRFYDVVYIDTNRKCEDVRKEFQALLKTQNVKVTKRTSL
jgi:hypothetical protein